MTDIASLGFSIDTTDVKGAESDLDRLAATGAKTEAAAKGVGNAWSGVGSKVSGANSAIKSTSTAVQQGNAALKAQQVELGKLLGQINPVVAALGRLDDQEEKLRKFKGKGLIDSETFNEYKVRIDQARTSLTAVDGTIRKTGVSSAQTAQALRQLPAQFTDIFTSLAGGQSPLLVLIQQGGQIKDSFGGIGNTFQALSEQVRGFFGASASSTAGLSGSVANATALGSALSGVVEQQAAMAAGAGDASQGLTDIAESANASAEAVGNAQTAFAGASTIGFATVAWLAAAAAAAVALGVAYKQGSDESTAYNKALILTGNIAGTNAEKLASMAKAIDDTVGTERQAAAALTEVAASGKFAADQIQGVATAAVAMNDATGKAVSETVKEFSRLADEPAAASAKLNQQYNYLTASVYEQITALEQQGDAAGAAQLAIDSFADAMNQRSNEIQGNLGLIEGGWENIKSAAAEAWDEMLGVGRPQTLEDQLAALNGGNGVASGVGSVAANYAVLGPIGAAKELYDRITPVLQAQTEEGRKQNDLKRINLELSILQRDTESAWQGERAKVNAAAVSAQDQLNKSLLNSRTNAEKLTAEYAKIDKLVKDAAAGGVTYTDSQIAQLRAAAQEQFKDKAPKAAKATPVYRDDAATQLLLTLRKQEASLQEQLSSETKLTNEQRKRAEFEAEIAELKTKDILTADQQSLLANQDAIRAQLDQNVALADAVNLHKEMIVEQGKYASFQARINDQLNQARNNLQLQAASSGLGQKDAQRLQDQIRIQQQFERQKNQIQEQFNSGDISQNLYDQETQALSAALSERLTLQQGYYSQLDEAQADWQTGYSSAMADFFDEQRNIAATTYDIVTNLMNGVTDGVSNSLASAIVRGDDLQESLYNVAQTVETQLLASFIKLGTQYAINATLGESVAAATSAASIAQAAAIAAAWAPAAAATSLASFGANAAPAAAGIASTNALAATFASGAGFKAGGYTGNGGINDVAGVVHGKEFVFDAAATSRIGIDKLESMRAGRDIATASARSSGSANDSSYMGGTNQYNTFNFPGITDAREAKKATAQAARDFSRVAAGTRRYS
ncbi:phage tail length tape measure family protein [Pseudomonas segetis]